MSTRALTSWPTVGHPSADRIDVTDAAGVRIGWVDPRTGVRNLLAPERRVEFDQMIDFWLAAAGLGDPLANGQIPAMPAPSEGTHEPTPAVFSHPDMRVSEVRYPDAEIVRSLLIPLRHLT